MHKEGKIRRLQGIIDALQKSQLQLKQEVRKLRNSKACQMTETVANEHLKKDNKRLKRFSEQLSKNTKQHKQEMAQLIKGTAHLREENARLRGMRSVSLSIVWW